jgi:Heavy metal associated domain 2
MAIKGIHVVHTMPGRVRLRVDKVKGNPAFAKKAQDKLGRLTGIKRVEAQPLTGSVLLYYDAALLLAEGALAALTDGFSELFPEIGAEAMNLGLESLLGHLASGGPPRSAGEPPQAANNLIGSLAAVNAEVSRLTGGLDLKLLVPMALLFFGVRSLWTSKQTAPPAWYDFFWFAFSTFVLLNLRSIETEK